MVRHSRLIAARMQSAGVYPANISMQIFFPTGVYAFYLLRYTMQGIPLSYRRKQKLTKNRRTTPRIQAAMQQNGEHYDKINRK